jgi:hypothetical protein
MSAPMIRNYTGSLNREHLENKTNRSNFDKYPDGQENSRKWALAFTPTALLEL